MSGPHLMQIGDTRDALGECPLWDAATGTLLWADCRNGVIRRLDPATGRRADHSVPAPIGSFALAEDGRAVVAMKDGFCVYDFVSHALTPLADLGIGHPAVRLNDGVADRHGRFICGTMHVGREPGTEPLGGLYRVDGSGNLVLLDTGIGVTNGPCFSPDGSVFYLADSAARRIWAYDCDGDGLFGTRRLFADLTDIGSAPDGATVDAEGGLWTALVHRGAIARYTPAGKLDRMVDMPMRHPTSVAFGGEALDTLFVTSISDSGRLTDTSDQAGRLFAVSGLGVCGLEEHRVRLG